MKKKRHRLLAFFVMILLATATISIYNIRYIPANLEIQKALAEQIIRFHVRANSDSDADQKLKLKVKDAVVTYLSPMLELSESLEQSREILKEHIEDIKNLALVVLENEGSSYGVNVYFEESYFPMKSYGDVTFPPGVYEAFRIDIGESSGKNWWCVLYPPLCFVDASMGVLPDSSKENLKNILTDEEYNAITYTRYEFRFKYLTFLNGLFD